MTRRRSGTEWLEFAERIQSIAFAADDALQHKKCTKCGVVKHLDQYKRDGRNKDGKRSECRTCTSKYRSSALRKTEKWKAYQRALRAQAKAKKLCPVCGEPKRKCYLMQMRKARKLSPWLLDHLHGQAIAEDLERSRGLNSGAKCQVK